MNKAHRASGTLAQSNPMRNDRPTATGEDAPRLALPKDSSRVEMMRRQKRMSAEERLALFEQLARFGDWARSARRVR